MKKLISILLALTILLSGIAVSSVMVARAALNDGKKLTVVITLEVGRYNSGGTFVPLKSGETVEKDEVLTVRIRPQSDFYCGVTRYIVMFSKEHYQIVGSGKRAFTPNLQNTFYAAVAPDYSGATTIPEFGWPESMRNAEFNTYSAVAVNNAANSNSANGGYPDMMPNDWLFRFDLKVLKKLTASSPGRIYIDNRWLRTPDNTTGPMYFTKLESKDEMSATGSSTTYKFVVDLKAADVAIPLGAEIPTLPSTTGPTTTTTKPTTTRPGDTTAPSTTAPTTVRPGETSTRPTTTGVPVTDSQGETMPVTDSQGEPVPVTDAQGEPVTNEQGSTVYEVVTKPVPLTTVVTVTDSQGEPVLVTDAQGKPVPVTDAQGEPVTDEQGSTVYEVVTKPVTVVTDAEGNPVPVTDKQGEPVTDEDGNTVYLTEPYTEGETGEGVPGGAGRIAAVVVAVLLIAGGGAAYVIIKKKRG